MGRQYTFAVLIASLFASHYVFFSFVLVFLVSRGAVSTSAGEIKSAPTFRLSVHHHLYDIEL